MWEFNILKNSIKNSGKMIAHFLAQQKDHEVSPRSQGTQKLVSKHFK